MLKISIIVPIYKVEPYLNRCIESILNQSYSNLEIILVDDGSPDNCPKICDFYANIDNRIIVIHKTNGGLSEARNYGLDIATGDYILFVDSDDYIRVDMCEVLLKNAMETNADMVVCDFYRVNNNSLLESSNNELRKEQINPDLYMHRFINERNSCYVVSWNKLYVKRLFDDLRYPVGFIHEDEFLIHELVYKCTLISCISDKLYYYTQREDSIMGSDFSAKRMDVAYAALEQYKFSKKIGNKELKDFNAERLSDCLLKYTHYLNDSACIMRYKDLTEKAKFLAFEKGAWKSISPRGRIYYRLEILFPNLMNWVHKGYMKLFRKQ